MVKKQNKTIMIIVLVLLALWAISQGDVFTGSAKNLDEQSLRNNYCAQYPGADIYECGHPTEDTLYCLDYDNTCLNLEDAGYFCINTQTPCPGVDECGTFDYTCSNGIIKLDECGDISTITTCGSGYKCEDASWTTNNAQSATNLKSVMCTEINNCPSGSITEQCLCGGDLTPNSAGYCCDGTYSTSPCQGECSDPDNGANAYTTKTTVTATTGDKVDFCESSNALKEGVCLTGGTSDYITVSCTSQVGSDYLCQDGACVCDDTSWTPNKNLYCVGTQVTQTSNCGTERIVVGTKTDSTCDQINQTQGCDQVCGDWSDTINSCGTRTCNDGTQAIVGSNCETVKSCPLPPTITCSEENETDVCAEGESCVSSKCVSDDVNECAPWETWKDANENGIWASSECNLNMTFIGGIIGLLALVMISRRK